MTRHHTASAPQGGSPRDGRRGGTVFVTCVWLSLIILIAAGAAVVWHRTSDQDPDPAQAADSSTARDCVTLLAEAMPDKAELVRSVSAIIIKNEQDGKRHDRSAADLMVVSYRERQGTIEDVVVQLYQPIDGGSIEVLNPDGVTHARLGDDLFGSAQTLMGLLYQPTVYLGPNDEVEQQQRAFHASVGGDLTLLREQTIEPLHVVAVMPHAHKFLPTSLRDRVDSVVLNSELTFGEWRSQISLLTDNGRAASQVGNTVAAWREMAVTLADTFASHSSGAPLREALEASTIQVADRRVIASARIPARTAVRVANELNGHAGGCPACPDDPSKVLICHREPDRRPVTLCLPPRAATSHLRQHDNDTCGACPGGGGSPRNGGGPPSGDGPGSGGNGNGDGTGGGGPSDMVGCSANYYKNVVHWPKGVTQLSLGDKVYTKDQCIALLKKPANQDASLVLAQQLIAAELNIIGGLPASEQIMQAITDADALLATFPDRLSLEVDPTSPAGEEMLHLAQRLTEYNQSCHDQAENKGNNGLGNGEDPQPPGNPPVNDGAGTSPGNPGNKK